MHVVNHLRPHLHTALTVLREHGMSEQRVWKQVSALTGWSVHRDVVNILNVCPETQMAEGLSRIRLHCCTSPPALADHLNWNDGTEGKMGQLRLADHFSPSFLIGKSKRELGGISVY